MKKSLLIPLMIVLAAVLIFGACAEPTPSPSPSPSPSPAPSPAPSPSPSPSPAPSPSPSPSPSPAPSPSPSPAPVKPMTVKLGYDTPPPTGLGVPAEFFAKEVTERTEGRVTVETYPAGTLSTMESSLESLRAGVADAYVISFGANREEFPVLSFTGIPGLDFFPHTQEMLKAETDTVREIIDKFPGAAEEMEGLKMLYSCTYTSAVLMGKGDQIRTPSGIKGLKVGCDGYRQDLVEYLEGAPVFTIPPFMYEQLQTGVIDITTVAWGAAMDWQLQELVDYVYNLTWGGGQLPCVISMDVWNKVSPQDQQIMIEVAAEAEQVNRDFVTGQIPDAKQLWKDTGIPILTPTEEELAQWEEAFTVIWDEYLEMNKDVPEIEAIFNYWQDAIETAQAGMFYYGE